MQIIFYKDRQGNAPVLNYIKELEKKAAKDKDARIRLKKIAEYLKYLEQYGTRLGQPIVKHIAGDIWELRPSSNRIFFFFWKDETFVLLHHFIKRTQKTPQREIDQAIHNMQDFLERS